MRSNKVLLSDTKMLTDFLLTQTIWPDLPKKVPEITPIVLEEENLMNLRED